MSLAYQTIGDPADSPFVFLHGLGGSASRTTGALNDLRGRFLVAPDLPGHGESVDYDPATFGFNQFADHVVALMDELGIKSTDLGGLSMGSGISLNLALRYPERVRSLTILRPSWLDQPRPEHLALVGKVGDWLLAGDPASARETLMADPDFIRLEEANPPMAETVEDLFQRPAREAYSAVLTRMWNDCPIASLGELGQIDVSCFVLSCPRDELHPQSVADAIAGALPDCRTTILPPRYHEPDEYQKELNSAVSGFLAECGCRANEVPAG